MHRFSLSMSLLKITKDQAKFSYILACKKGTEFRLYVLTFCGSISKKLRNFSNPFSGLVQEVLGNVSAFVDRASDRTYLHIEENHKALNLDFLLQFAVRRTSHSSSRKEVTSEMGRPQSFIAVRPQVQTAAGRRPHVHTQRSHAQWTWHSGLNNTKRFANRKKCC